MKHITDKDFKTIKNVLLHCIGDMRLCPNCDESFIPNDQAQKKAVELYDKLFGYLDSSWYK
jgi:hypothetical protein